MLHTWLDGVDTIEMAIFTYVITWNSGTSCGLRQYMAVIEHGSNRETLIIANTSGNKASCYR